MIKTSARVPIVRRVSNRLRGAFHLACLFSLFIAPAFSVDAQVRKDGSVVDPTLWSRKANFFIVESDEDAVLFAEIASTFDRSPNQYVTLVHLQKKPDRSGTGITFEVQCNRSVMRALIATAITQGGLGKQDLQPEKSVDLSADATGKLIKNIACDPAYELDDDQIYEGTIAEFAKEFWK